MGAYYGGTINSKHIAQVCYSIISDTFVSIFFLLLNPNAFSAILYVNYAKEF